MLFDQVEAIVVVAGKRRGGDGGRENLTGLVRAASGGRWPPEADQAAPAAPLHRGIYQRDERLDVALSEGLECGADRIDAHVAKLLPARPPSNRQARGLKAA
jgi:hypothetical protein